MSDPTPSERQAANTSLGDLLGEVTSDMSTLIRQELALAKAELQRVRDEGRQGRAACSAAPPTARCMAVLFLSIAFWWALATSSATAGPAVVIAVVWAIIAAILFSVGRKQLKQVKGRPQTVDTLKEIPDTLKRNEENR